MKNSPAALSSDSEPATAASDLIVHPSEPTLAGTGGNPGQDDGHPRRHGNQADEHEDEQRFSLRRSGWRGLPSCRNLHLRWACST